ncbi:MAG: hypothetical protein C0425_06745 [Chlorobiaceae bacterium]|nr:hypothetical protein [Chlorobiaceae bacterium]MBA4310019.1 hypothetical protein [Chlorobiaceae bacterium]
MKSIEIFIKNLLLQLILLLSKKVSSKEKIVTQHRMKILIVRLNNIGDALVTTPFIALLKKNLNCELLILASHKNYFVFKNNPAISEIIIFKKGIKNILTQIKEINKNEYDVIIDSHDDLSTTVATFVALTKSKYKIGFAKGIDKLFTHLVKRENPTITHVIDRLLNLSLPLSISPDRENANVKIYPEEKDNIEIENVFASIFPEKKFNLFINISEIGAARFWGIKNYQNFLRDLKKYPINILVTTLQKDFQIVKENFPDEKIYYTESFLKFAALISKANLLFTPDTSIVHLASACQVPVFGLYVKYKTENMIWSPYRSEYDAIVTTEANLWNVNYEEVARKFFPFLEKQIKKSE